jgi:hypothetical protein
MITPEQYEKLGSFYLGREYSMQDKTIQDNLVLYDSKDLVTHGVVLGMTGSGKTGLCLTLLEEAAMDGIPLIAIDPKGDIGNALLTFPNLSAQEFRPWINEDDARRKGCSPDDYAQAQADTWKKGLADWGQSQQRIAKLRETVEMSIYTPGSSAGLSVSILSSLSCPNSEILEDAESLAERIESTVSSLLGLLDIDADPVQSPEHILISNIISHHWKKNQNVSLENLVQAIQQPPIRKIGVVDVNSFFPEAKRTALAMKLNNLIASPGFASWLEGEPLDIQRMYYTPEGKPRITIFNIAHLNDSERMFFVSLLLNQLLGWMRSQKGTTSLRALFYMDEIFGYLPPSAMPPSKRPLMILLKQARAFGLGILLATQNPVDLDYKALSNIGTWWLGRLQTERDKARVLDGLEGALSSNGSPFNRNQMEALLSGLGNRIFLMNNVHEDAPIVFHVRWIMSYLSGPLAKEQIKRLMAEPKKALLAKNTKISEDDGFLPPSSTSSNTQYNSNKPQLPENASEYFYPIPSHLSTENIVFQPTIIRSSTVVFDDPKKQIQGSQTFTFINPIDIENQKVLWDKSISLSTHPLLKDWMTSPPNDATYLDLPSAAVKSTTYTAIKKDFPDEVLRKATAQVHFNPDLEIYSNPNEPIDQFKARISQQVREQRDATIEELRLKSAKTAKTLEEKAEKAQAKVDEQNSQATSAKLQAAVQIGSSLLGAFLGRKSSISSVFKSTSISSASRVMKESRDASSAKAELANYQEDLKVLEQEISDQTQKIRDQFDLTNLKLISETIIPLKKNIIIDAVGILWIPCTNNTKPPQLLV